MARKEFNIPKETLKILHEIMEEKGFKTEVSTIIYLIDNYKTINQNLPKEIIKEMEKKFSKAFTSIRLAAQASQKNTYITLDVINSMLYDSKTSDLFQATDSTRHPIVAQSEANYKEMIEKRKQIKDNDNLKKGN